MSFSAERIPCSAKLNLTLRVTDRYSTGFHELCSIFLRVGPTDYLTIKDAEEDNVSVKFKIKKSGIQGRNILLKTLDKIRAAGIKVPPLDMVLEKSIPPGTGMGCGSGDAAGLLEFLHRTCSVNCDAFQFGSDVPFFCEKSGLALVEGMGEIIRPLDDSLLKLLKIMVVIPSWRCETSEMYRQLDQFYVRKWPLNQTRAERESEKLLYKLAQGEHCGLLPNDFTPVLMKKYGEYQKLFDVFSMFEALAWGITGSGSAAFAIWKREISPRIDLSFPWVEDTFIF